MHCPVMRYHGGKWRIASWVISHFPRHQVYVEPFGGAAGVLMQKPPVSAEVYNDLDGEIVNVFRVLRDPASAERLSELCRFTPYARAEFDLSQEPADDPIEQARRTLLRAWASFGSAGATRGNSGMRTFTRPDGVYLGVAHAWARVADAIPEFANRFRNVVIESRPAVDVMTQHDSRETLLEAVRRLQGLVVISGYDSTLYNNRLPGWMRVTLPTSGSSRFGSVKRTECLWLSPRVIQQQRQRDMFAMA